MAIKYCNDCSDCKAVKGKLYCAKHARDISNGKTLDKKTLYVKREDQCKYGHR